MNERAPKSIEERKRDAIIEVTKLREQVVHEVGICGRGTHPLTEIIESFERDEIKPENIEEVVAQAYEIKKSICGI